MDCRKEKQLFEKLSGKFRKNQASLCVLELGYVGLPTASIFATHSQHLLSVDVNQNLVDKLT